MAAGSGMTKPAPVEGIVGGSVNFALALCLGTVIGLPFGLPRHNRKRLLMTLLLDALKLRNFLRLVKNVANSRWFTWICIFRPVRHASVMRWVCSTYSAWGLCKFARSTNRAMRRPQSVGRATVLTSRFLYINQSKTNQKPTRRSRGKCNTDGLFSSCSLF